MWDHLATCTVCRDRYWEMATKAKTAQRQAQAHPMGMIGGHPLIGLIQQMMGSANPQQLSWQDVAVKILAHVEKLGDEELTPENMDIEELSLPDFADPEHTKRCPGCQQTLRRLIIVIKQQEKSMPHQAQRIARVVKFLEGFTVDPATLKGDENDPSLHQDGGEPRFFAS